MRYHTVKSLALLLAAIIGCLLCACSNSEGLDYANHAEEIAAVNEVSSDSGKYIEEESIAEPEKHECFDSFRLPDLQSIACKKQFYSNDTVKEFPQSGFFQKTFSIVFPDNKLLNCEIGGKPATRESPLVSKIQVDSSMTIRCADFSGNAANYEIIRTYILEKNPDIAAVFLTTDPNSLFDPDTGIYMEGPNAEEKYPHYGANYWLDKEVPVFVELVESEQNQPAFAKYAGLKIFGNYSRVHPKKSVAITFREKYGDNRLNYPLFPDYPELTVFKNFILRNSGNSFGNDYVRDRLMSSISDGLGVDYQRGRYAIVYYNGQYFGIHDLREKSNEYYFETHYGINHKNINLLKADNSISAGSADDYVALTNWLEKHSLHIDSNYTYIASKIDINNYINYMQIEMYANNRDWPGNNLKKWNSPTHQDLWKWFLYDLDLSLGNGGSNSPSNIFRYTLAEKEDIWQNNPKFTFLFRSLMENESFKKAFINRMTTLMQTYLESSRFIFQMESMMNNIRTEIPRDQKRWHLSESKITSNLEIIKNFIINRPTTIIQNMQEYFKFKDTSSVTLDIKGNGTILVHNLPLKQSSATITFFEDLPVVITAVSEGQDKWSCWSDGDTNTTRIIYPEKHTKLTAIFE